MRDVHVCTYNVMGNNPMLADLMEWLAAGLDEFGIGLTHSTSFRADAPNIIFEHKNSIYKDFLASPRGKDLTIVCFVTEYILNGIEFDHYGHVPPGVNAGQDRLADFMAIADRYAGFITTV